MHKLLRQNVVFFYCKQINALIIRLQNNFIKVIILKYSYVFILQINMFKFIILYYVTDAPTILKRLIEMKSKHFSDEEDNLM